MTQPVPSSPAQPPESPDTMAAAPVVGAPPVWADPARRQAYQAWLAQVAPAHGLDPASAVLASADASFRRYLRVQGGQGSRIVMDAPPDKENCAPFVDVARRLAEAGLHVPQVLAWDEAQGFMLLSDLGQQTLMSVLDPAQPRAAEPLYRQAVDTLVTLQTAGRAEGLPAYDEALLRRELALFPDWYLAQHRQCVLDEAQRAMLDKTFDAIVRHNLAAPRVLVHRDFMPRNLMLGQDGGPLGVLDFQDAVHGPVTYDIASLMRDAFLTWEEDFVLDITVRYWQKARAAGLMDFEDWHSDFGAFYRAVEWMGLQRHLKVAGIFARLTLRDGKPKYLADTPRFIHYIRSTASRYRELAPLLRFIDQVENLQAASGWAFGRV